MCGKNLGKPNEESALGLALFHEFGRVDLLVEFAPRRQDEQTVDSALRLQCVAETIARVLTGSGGCAAQEWEYHRRIERRSTRHVLAPDMAQLVADHEAHLVLALLCREGENIGVEDYEVAAEEPR